MRDLDIFDLHDYYDFSANIEEKAKEIRSQILKAQYKSFTPLMYRVEKRYGICRHLMIPAPSDALIFQTITEHLSPELIKAQPTKKAYYSRDKHRLKLPHQFKGDGYPWPYLWPKYQKDILKFTDDCDYLVVTDITDFFDNIGLRELRHIVSSHITVDEVILDLLFSIIEQLNTAPDYLPTSLKGLPTINIEAFRLLPHVMLFEIDEVINSLATGNFVRWMDDINVGVNSKDEAYRILENINEVLKSRGLALSISKTIIYTADEAKTHFLFDENAYLNQIDKENPLDPSFSVTKAEFLKRFRLHLNRTSLRNWDKVTKRYFTIAGKLGITELRKYVIKLFVDNPSIRKNILYYISLLKFTKRTGTIILDLLQNTTRYDDVSLFSICKLITDMEIPRTKTGFEFVKEANKLISKVKSDTDLYCYLWFLAKYGEPRILMDLIERAKNQWRNEQFLARQVVSVLPRLLKFNETIVSKWIDEQMTSGPRDAASVATHIHSLRTTTTPSTKLNAYLFPPRQQKPYPLPKYLILTNILASSSLLPAVKKKFSTRIRKYITDPWYIYWLNANSMI